MSKEEKVRVATELAFKALVDQANKLGLPLMPVLGLRYMPDPAVTDQFEAACRSVLASIASEIS